VNVAFLKPAMSKNSYYLIFGLILGLAFLASDVSASEVSASEIETHLRDIEVVERGLEQAKKRGDERRVQILTQQLELRREQLKRIDQGQGARNINEPSKGHSRPNSLSETQVELRGADGQVKKVTIKKGSELRYISELYGTWADEKEMFPVGKVEKILSDSTIELSDGRVIQKRMIKAVFLAVPLLGGAKALLNAADYVTSATPAIASTRGAPFMDGDKGLEKFFKLPLKEQKEILEVDPKFAKYLDALFEGVVHEAGGRPQNITCESNIIFQLAPSDPVNGSERVVHIKKSSDGKIAKAVVEEIWGGEKCRITYDFNENFEVVRITPEVPTLKGQVGKKVNRPMDEKSFNDVAKGFSDGKGISNLINQSQALPGYLQLVGSEIEAGCGGVARDSKKAGASSHETQPAVVPLTSPEKSIR
jgi:hypothetical protein